MHRKGFTTYPDLQESLDCASEQVHERLRTYFEADSLTAVSPRQFEQFVSDNGLSDGLITLSRNAEVVAMEKAGMSD